MADCCDPIVPPRNCIPRCNPYVDAVCVVDATAHSCLGTDEDATQAEINAAINTLLCCPTWTTVTLPVGWSTQDGAQSLQYSNINRCIVRLRGTVNVDGSQNSYSNAFTLPSTHVPLLTRYFSATNISNFLTGPIHIRIQGASAIAPGLVSVFFPALFIPSTITVSFDGLTFETN